MQRWVFFDLRLGAHRCWTVKAACCLGISTSSNPITQPYVTVAALHPLHPRRDVLKRHLIMYLPWPKTHLSHFRQTRSRRPYSTCGGAALECSRFCSLPQWHGMPCSIRRTSPLPTLSYCILYYSLYTLLRGIIVKVAEVPHARSLPRVRRTSGPSISFF
jgi:hypothetical protein